MHHLFRLSKVIPLINLQAQFTVEQVTGTFFNSGEAYLFTGTEYEVLGITGTLNGSPMTLTAAPQGIGSWLYEQGSNFELGTVYFTANGSFSWLENDAALTYWKFSMRMATATGPTIQSTGMPWTLLPLVRPNLPPCSSREWDWLP